jgi:membrane-associated protease RseP (regulator of RpoE activity)
VWPWAPPPRPSIWREYGRNAVLFLLTALSVFLAGGPYLVLGLLSILVAHEMGHYVACRLYRVDATLPFFIPFPSLVGTLGAFIRIRGPIPTRRALFDIGVAGPLAGFVICLPVLLLGIGEARILNVDPDRGGIFLGEPLLFQWAVRLLRGEIPDGMTLSLGPLGLAAWFGLLVTALNLIPIGQLDGGHLTYALLRHKAGLISRIGSWVCVGLIYFGPNWILWAILVRVLGRRHPPTLDDDAPVGRARVWVALLSLAVFILCFVPNPIVWSWRDAFEDLSGFLPSFTSR